MLLTFHKVITVSSSRVLDQVQYCVGFEVLTVMATRSSIFLVITPFNSLQVNLSSRTPLVQYSSSNISIKLYF
jgi:hypothetical protein